MNDRPRIVLIHATRVAMAPVDSAFAARWPEAETLSLLDEGLSVDLATARATRAELDGRINALADHAMGMAPDAILYTCSAFGTGIERAAARLDIPVLKPNEAMFESAIAQGGRITMLYTFAPAVEGMEREFHETAKVAGSHATLRSVAVPGALEALRAGDPGRHDELIAAAAGALPEGEADAVMLAHFSMARAADAARRMTRLPVLTSPEAAIGKLKAALGVAPQDGASC